MSKYITEEYGISDLNRKKAGMGLETMYGEGFVLTGGMRVGSSPAGMERRGYSIIDVEKYEETNGNWDQCFMGIVHLMVSNNNDILGLINIKLNPKTRKAGIGRAVVKSLVETAPNDFVIWDIQKSAIGFWKKMGTELYTTGGKEIPSPRKFSGLIMGVIRKPGSNTPISELPGFTKSK